MSHEPFTSHDHAKEVREQADARRRQLSLDYAATFAGTRGEAVLNDLKRLFGFNKPSAVAGMRNEDVWLREGMKLPLYHIQHQLALAKSGGRKQKPAKAKLRAEVSRERVPEIPEEKQ
jgi:hypothetical protein